MAIQVVLADDHEIFREGLKGLLHREGFQVAGEASNGLEAIEMCQRIQPEILVLDIAMPMLNGMDAAREVHKSCPGTKCIVLSMHTEDKYVLESLQAGVMGYVLKSKAFGELTAAIGAVLNDDLYLSPEVSRTVVQAYLTKSETIGANLTSRERQVLQLIAEGKSTKEIAALLGVSYKAAETHRVNLMEKLSIRDTAGLVRYAIRIGLIQP
jgi:two-component system, NarL family, response regulator NreC